jgi:hypothetical protein
MKIIAEPVLPVTQFRKSVPANVSAALDKALEKIPADRGRASHDHRLRMGVAPTDCRARRASRTRGC